MKIWKERCGKTSVTVEAIGTTTPVGRVVHNEACNKWIVESLHVSPAFASVEIFHSGVSSVITTNLSSSKIAVKVVTVFYRTLKTLW